MKKFLPLFVFLFLFAICKAQYVSIPDNNFANFLLQNYPACISYQPANYDTVPVFPGGYVLDTTCSSFSTIENKDSLNLNGLGIIDLTGIEYFRSLTYLTLTNNSVEIYPALPKHLKYLDISNFIPFESPFGYIPALPDSLVYLNASNDGMINGFPALPSTLQQFICSNDGLHGLPALPNSLVYLDCSNQTDQTLTSSPRSLGGLPALPNSLTYLNCSDNALTSLPALPNSLTTLDCSGTGWYDIDYNFSPTLFCVPRLPNSLTGLGLPGSVGCLPNLPPHLFTSLPICNSSNDPYHCLGFPTISGTIFYDYNKNGIQDSGEVTGSNVQLKLSSGSQSGYTYSDNNGNYQISPDTLGNYTLTVNAPLYYKNIPDSISYTFNRFDTTVAQQNFALQSTINKDSLHINVIPEDLPAFAGTAFIYKIVYSNPGTTMLSANLAFSYKSSLLIYDSSSNKFVVNVGNKPAITGLNLFPGEKDSFSVFFTVNDSALNGEILYMKVLLSSNSVTTADSTSCVIQNFSNPIAPPSQYVVIPDDSFRLFLMNKYPACFGDTTGRLDTSCSEVINEDTLLMPGVGIQNLEGIEYFKSLTYLNIEKNSIITSPQLPNSLKSLDISNFVPIQGPFGYIPPLPRSLTYLNCSNGGMLAYKFPVLPDSLQYLYCADDALYNLPPLPNSLVYLDCSGQVDFTLETLPTTLSSLGSSLPKSLKFLNCSSNALSSLPALPDSLVGLDCSNEFYNTYGDVGSPVPTLFCLPVLPASLTSLSIDPTITCLPNLVAGIHTNLSVCSPVNDVHHCQGFPVISGNIFYDINSNGLKDTNEFYAANNGVQLTGNARLKSSFTNDNGYYKISPDSIGNYIFTANVPNYYKAVPDSINYTFGRYDTAVSQNIALQPTANVDSVQISITPYNLPRPGLDLAYFINYSNAGTTTLTANIALNYNNTLLAFNTASGASFINTGNSLTATGINLSPGQAGNFIADFIVNPADLPGELINTNAEISANAVIGVDTVVSEILSSFDPNNKQATPMLTPNEVSKGKPINYIVHFQNTGNDYATNIVIADTLSNLLDAGTVQVNSSSLPCVATVDSNIIYFEFLNISLPDSNFDKAGSNGFVNFSVKPKLGVNSGSINNKASIYFDYNVPVVTNTAITLIQDSNSVVPLRLLSFTALTQPNTSNALLYWSTTNEINTNYFVIEQSTDGINFTAIGNVTAKNQLQNNYTYNVITNNPTTYYRLKLVDNTGKYSYSTIIVIKRQQDNYGFVILNNPAKNIINIRVDDKKINNTIARIIDNHGATVKEFILHNGMQSIDVSILSAGEYYIQTQFGSVKEIINR